MKTTTTIEAKTTTTLKLKKETVRRLPVRSGVRAGTAAPGVDLGAMQAMTVD